MSEESVSFECRADGVPLPTIVWLKDGDVITSTNKFEIENTTLSGGQTAISVLTISNLSVLDSGNYTCRASISHQLPDPFSLTVEPLPPPDFCSPNPCLNGGHCTSTSSSFQCECLELFVGQTCEVASSSAQPDRSIGHTTIIGAGILLLCVIFVLISLLISQ